MFTSTLMRAPAFSRCLPGLSACLFLIMSAGLAEAQAPVPPAAPPTVQVPVGKRPNNLYLMIFGYEMDKARADSIVQTQDMGKGVSQVLEKLEALTRSKGATHVSNAATPLMSGVRCTLKTEAFFVEAEGYLAPATNELNLKLTRQAKVGGTSSAVSARLDLQGTPIFIGTVPDVSPGRDQLLFMRCVVHLLE